MRLENMIVTHSVSVEPVHGGFLITQLSDTVGSSKIICGTTAEVLSLLKEWLHTDRRNEPEHDDAPTPPAYSKDHPAHDSRTPGYCVEFDAGQLGPQGTLNR